MLERHIFGHFIEGSISESVPAISKKGESWLLAGAAKLAANISDMNDSVVLAGVVGMDDEGARAKNMISCLGIPMILSMDASRDTVVKHKISADGELLLCIENGSNSEIQGKAFNEIIKIIMIISDDIDFVMIADYDMGVITTDLVEAINNICHNKKVAAYVAADNIDYSKYGCIEMIYTDQYVLEYRIGKKLRTIQDFQDAAVYIFENTKAKSFVINMGTNGLILFNESPKEWMYIPFSWESDFNPRLFLQGH